MAVFTSTSPLGSKASRIAGMAALSIALSASLCAHALEVNTANEAELDSLRGLGPDSTARILQARESGPFADWQDLMRRVKGIKAATAQKLSRQGLTVAGQVLDIAPPKPAP